MQGILVFRSLVQALSDGFHVYDRRTNGYLVRKQTNAGWAFAFVDLDIV
ncbi:MAG TPA: hypothetical protein VGZ02_00080 [Candidatus Baltobacteraceae bacterium]|jgi:hypothetical protein|nr:hypothetical protein [Candidatus Baltobacteraceae bacterium]